jgi:UDP-glucose:(heptosyl)LPS alpha-1,3-glucosyltransferase
VDAVALAEPTWRVMKIALSFPGFHRRGGAERVALETARYLAQRGHEVHVFCSELEVAPSLGIIHHAVPTVTRPWFLTAPTFHRRCSQMLDVGQFDAVGAFGAPSPIGGVYWAQSVHPAWLHHARTFRRPLSLSRWKQRLNPVHPITLRLEGRHFAPGAHQRIIALTEAVKLDLANHYHVPASLVDVLPVGYDPAEFNVARATHRRAATRKSLGFTDADRVVLFAANELERKGLGPLIGAIAALAEPAVQLLVVGKAAPSEYSRRIADLGLADSVTYAGTSTDMAAYYGAADLLALPTQYEAWGLVVIEALACGIPVLTTARAGAAVAVDNGRTGVLIKQPDDVEEICAGLTTLFRGPIASAAEFTASAARFTWPTILSRYEQILLSSGQ